MAEGKDKSSSSDKMPEEWAAELDLGEPPPDVIKYARDTLGENPDTRAKCVQDLRDMIYERGECIPHRTDDAFLLRFLRARHFIVERAHRLVVNYYLFKEENPEICTDIEPLKLRHIGDADVLSVAPYREQTGRRLMIYRVGNWDPNEYTMEEIFKATLVVLELGILEQRAQILGGVAIFDFENLSMQHAWQVTPAVASRVIKLMVTSFPMKTHALHIVFQSWMFDTVYAVFKPFLDERMKEKVFFHGSDMESLHQHIKPAYLPEKYGGVRPDYPYTHWIDYLKKNYDIVKEMKSLGYKFDKTELPSKSENGTDNKGKAIINEE